MTERELKEIMSFLGDKILEWRRESDGEGFSITPEFVVSKDGCLIIHGGGASGLTLSGTISVPESIWDDLRNNGTAHHIDTDTGAVERFTIRHDNI